MHVCVYAHCTHKNTSNTETYIIIRNEARTHNLNTEIHNCNSSAAARSFGDVICIDFTVALVP